MAKIQYGAGFDIFALDQIYGSDVAAISASATRLIYSGLDGAQIVVSGKALVLKNGAVKSGTVTGVSFVNADGATLLQVTGGTFKAKDLYAAYAKHDSVEQLAEALFAGHDTIKGTNGDDEILGLNPGNDTVFGMGGEDFIEGSAGNNKLDGGADWDILSYDPSTYGNKALKTGITLNAATGTVKNPWGGTDKIANFEEFRGTNAKDTMTGSKADEGFAGLKGADVIDGGAGYDTLRYSRDERFGGTKAIVANLDKGKVTDGFGTVETVKNIESITGTRFGDSFTGDAKDNSFRGLAGVDSYKGGAGWDTVNLNGESNDAQDHGARVDMRLSSGQIVDDGYGNTETTVSIENIQGTRFSDDLVMGADDGLVNGRGGDDRITAGAGEQVLIGGEGSDTFVFLSAADSSAGTNKRDIIKDFSQAEADHIDLSALGVSLEFVGEGSLSAGSAKLAYSYNTDGNTIVSADTDGDGQAELQFLLKGKIALVQDDFILA
ncbi:hypothetical protein BJF93_16105 [Xaviernesmea oryzae]|uniref:Uncharacterized protein n=1 Tax=Xaviernesmea oryzae TaxID=464029 RepID=A0A1Q9ASK3_9HYPH|nr:calcium-binding protein [Xaviernesmea oryzae]OLP58407.1 hypothetical protein BJF93_16105 [Xaviernesmea oryzae]SEM33669.1 type I secretion C-terminal target domain (VC_A0849 subclass) [Xaviernesmea oryzae]